MDKKNITRPILGKSKAIQAVIKLIDKVAKTKTNILIIGESGTGKELIARMIHESSPMAGKPFIPVNCGAIPENLIESEMFGHKRGSFTGAVSDKMGLFEAANGGTLFLDEVGELPLSMQVKLLRAIQDHTIRKVGGLDDTKVDARIIAATNRDLEMGVKNGTFREDLYYRLNVIMIKSPPLRDREEDIDILMNHFLTKFAERQKKSIKGFEPDAEAAIKAYSWPGNIRELENSLERAVTLEPGEMISKAVLPSQVIQNGAKSQVEGSGTTTQLKIDFSTGSIDLDRTLFNLETLYLEEALKQAKGKVELAASMLGMTASQYQERIKKRKK